MTTELPNVTPNGRYSVTQAADALEVHRNTILRWIGEGKIKFGIRRTNGRKFIEGRTLTSFWKSQY